jgi:tyrosyl-tRNA synthetase
LNLKLAAQTMPDAPVTEEALPQEAQEVLAHKVGRPPGAWTHLGLLVAIAKLGGFLARKHDGTPGGSQSGAAGSASCS